ncbi:hypothetical protein AYI68_g1732, partial [Smittium mucronatum]
QRYEKSRYPVPHQDRRRTPQNHRTLRLHHPPIPFTTTTNTSNRNVHNSNIVVHHLGHPYRRHNHYRYQQMFLHVKSARIQIDALPKEPYCFARHYQRRYSSHHIARHLHSYSSPHPSTVYPQLGVPVLCDYRPYHRHHRAKYPEPCR